MLVCNPYEVVIHGTTSKGKIFRPSDWAERLCGILSSFTKDNRLSYSNWVRPILVDNVRCVAVDKKLEEDNPQMFRFLMDFAADNDLRVIDCKALLKEQESKQQGEVPVRKTGYRLLGIFEEGKQNAVAVCGFHAAHNLASGYHIHIDDLVTMPQCRQKGYASRLLEEVRKIGAETGATKIHLNVHVNHDRADAHRLYFKNGFEICAYHFRCDPK